MLCAMPVTARIDGLGELLDQQFSVASRGQLMELGMKDTAMRWRVRAGGPWQTLLPGVYLGLRKLVITQLAPSSQGHTGR